MHQPVDAKTKRQRAPKRPGWQDNQLVIALLPWLSRRRSELRLKPLLGNQKKVGQLECSCNAFLHDDEIKRGQGHTHPLVEGQLEIMQSDEDVALSEHALAEVRRNLANIARGIGAAERAALEVTNRRFRPD